MNRIKRRIWELKHPEEAEAKARRKFYKVKNELTWLEKWLAHKRRVELWKG